VDIDNINAAFTTLDANQAPSADAGGPYSVPEGGSLALDGSASSDADGTVASYEWDFDYDGVSFDVDAAGVAPTFSAAALDGPSSRTIALRVTDDDGAVSAIVTASLAVTNVAPTAGIAGPADGLLGQTLSFTLGATDVSAADQVADFTYDIDWNGDGIVDQTETGPASFSVDHVFADAGLATVIVTATDKDGGVSAPVNLGVNVIQPIDFAALPRRISLNGNGIFTVVIKSTADFDARSLDLASLRLSGVAALRSVYSDVDHDGDSDLILFFRRRKFLALYKAAVADDIADGKLDSNVQAVDLVLTGKTVDGADIHGSQTVKLFMSGQKLRTVLHSLGFASSNRQGRVRHR
jgi:hypothetical protein